MITLGRVAIRMSRDQRVADNWALLYAVEKAATTGASVAVVFNLVSLPFHIVVVAPRFIGLNAAPQTR